MSSIKKAKKAKRVKSVKTPKSPKSAVKQRLTKEEKQTIKRAKKLMKTAKKINDIRAKYLNRVIGITAVVLCIVSSVLDVLLQRKNK